jgi:hypothetical protein
MNRIKIISILLLFIPTLLYSQQERLTFREKRQIEIEVRSSDFDWKVINSMRDSLLLNIIDGIMNDSLLQKYFNPKEENVDLVDIKIFMARGGEMVSLENNTARRWRKRNEYFNAWEILLYMSKNQVYPCHLVKSIEVNIKFSSAFETVHLLYKFGCEPAQIKIINREEVFE